MLIVSSPGDRASLIDAIKPFLELVPRISQQAVVEVFLVRQRQHIVQGEVAQGRVLCLVEIRSERLHE